MYTLGAFVSHLQNEIIIVPTSEECGKNGENSSNMWEQCLARTADPQSLRLLLLTDSLQPALATVAAALTSQREAYAQVQRSARDYTSSKKASTVPTQTFLSLKPCHAFEAASFSWWSLWACLYHVMAGKAGPADSMVPSSIPIQGGCIKAAAAGKQDQMPSVPLNAVSLAMWPGAFLYLGFQFFFSFLLFLSRVLSTFPN